MIPPQVQLQIQDLANLMKAKRASGQKFVIMLGAGASMSSGVKPTPVIMQELLAAYGRGIGGDTLEQRFDLLWNQASDDERDMFLKAYLDVEPSDGYAKLAALLADGYFDLVVTFNFDDLLEQAIRASTLQYKVIIRGEADEQAIGKLLDNPVPRCKLLKLHGSLHSSKYFLFSIDEMARYNEPTETLLKRLTAGDIIVCGYAFLDICVIRAFAEEGKAVVCVNPSGVPRSLQPFLNRRRSEERAIPTDFDTFFTELHRMLLGPSSITTAERPLLNPFKFLQSYEEEDREAFTERDDVIEEFFQKLAQPPLPRVIVIVGREKAGKTSLVKASLLPRLEDEGRLGLYVRCKLDWAQSIVRDIADQAELAPGDPTLASVLLQLGTSSPDRHVVLFLDEFDRVVGRERWRSKAGKQQLNAFLRQDLLPGCNDNLTLVLVITEEESLGGWVLQRCFDAGQRAALVECTTFEGSEVKRIVESLAAKGALQFDSRIIDEMVSRYEKTRTGPVHERFTLAHIHAVCHILASKRRVEYDSYKSAFEDNLTALNQAINVHDIMSFVEDFSWPDAVWLRNMIKVPLQQSKDLIAAFIKKHYAELMPQRGAGDEARRSRVRRVG